MSIYQPEIPNYLFRALRKEEIEKGNILIPKSIDTFESNPSFPISFPFNFGKSEEHAIDNHQKFDGKNNDRGISTSKYFEIAKKYAQENKYIAIINTEQFDKLGIKAIEVKFALRSNPTRIKKPEDNEIILVYEKDGNIPF